MPRPMTAAAMTTRAILVHAAQGLPAAQRGWGLAMLAELEEIPDPREATSWALGALRVVWGRRLRAWWRAAWGFVTDWRAWRSRPIAPVPVPVWLVVIAAALFSFAAEYLVRGVVGSTVAWDRPADGEFFVRGESGGLVLPAIAAAAIVLNLAGRIEASLHSHRLYTRKLPRGDMVDRGRQYPWVGWPLTALVTAALAVAEIVHFMRYGQLFPFLEIYAAYWTLIWPQVAARITLRRNGWRDPRAQNP